MQIDILTEVDDDFSQLARWFEENTYTFEKVYASFGSKWNVSHIQFSYPDKIKNQPYYTNSAYQMVPFFLRYPELESTIHLAIVIDDFHREESLRENMIYLKHQLEETAPAVRILLVNKCISPQNILACFQVLTLHAENAHIEPKNMWFANYIRFQHPNTQEATIEQRITRDMYSSLKRLNDGKYASRLYRWYGPTFYYYNYIYAFNEASEIRMMHKTRLQTCVFEKVDPGSQLDPSNYDAIERFVSRNTQFLEIWGEFKETSIHIVEDHLI